MSVHWRYSCAALCGKWGMVRVSSGSLNTSNRVVVSKIYYGPLHLDIPPKRHPHVTQKMYQFSPVCFSLKVALDWIYCVWICGRRLKCHCYYVSLLVASNLSWHCNLLLNYYICYIFVIIIK
jgi:hypothetical protein